MLPDLFVDLQPFTHSRYHDVAPFLLARELEVSLSDATMELEALELEPALRATPARALVTNAGAPQTVFRLQIEQHRKSRTGSTGHELVEGSDQPTRQAPCETLIRNAGIREPIGDHDASFIKGWPDDLSEVLSPVGKVESKLDLRCHPVVGRMQKDPAYLATDLRAPRLAGQETGVAGFLQSLRKELGLCGFATAFDSFEADQETRASRQTLTSYHIRLR